VATPKRTLAASKSSYDAVISGQSMAADPITLELRDE
jgi:hypothetical protein